MQLKLFSGMLLTRLSWTKTRETKIVKSRQQRFSCLDNLELADSKGPSLMKQGFVSCAGKNGTPQSNGFISLSWSKYNIAPYITLAVEHAIVVLLTLKFLSLSPLTACSYVIWLLKVAANQDHWKERLITIINHRAAFNLWIICQCPAECRSKWVKTYWLHNI